MRQAASVPSRRIRLEVFEDRGEDRCPLGGALLAGQRAATRRQPVMSPEPGTFRWRCPEGDGVWQVNGPGSSTRGGPVAPDTTASADLLPAP